MANWADIFKSFSGVFTEPPVVQASNINNISGAGITQSDALTLKDNSPLMGNRFIALRDSNDLIDVSLSNIGRYNRNLEYERLRVMPEIETTLTIYADETCVVGDTEIITPFGNITIEQLAKEKDQDEKFLVYCYDFKKQDFTLGWAFNPRLVKRALTYQVVLDNGDIFTTTPDHRVLLRNGTWKCTEDLEHGDEIMWFNRVKPLLNFKDLPHNRHPRIRTLKSGWQTEKLFIKEFQANGIPEELKREHGVNMCFSSGMPWIDVANVMGVSLPALKDFAQYYGIVRDEFEELNDRYPDSRKVLRVVPHKCTDVYDMSVLDHENFATTTGIMHNCQLGENGHCFEIRCKNKEAQKIAEKLCHEDLEMDDSLWMAHRNLCLYGDEFWELVIDPASPSDGILKIQSLPASTMYVLVTVYGGRVVEFQQSAVGADPAAVSNPDITHSSTGAIRFTPQQIIHLKLGGDRRMFYPYGESILEQAKSAAHQLRLMEDAMTTYRLTRSPSRRVFYIDIDQLPPAKAEALMERTKDQFRKKKVFNNRTASGLNASGVEERWNPMSFDEDIWISVRQGSQTRIETVQEQLNWDQIGDILYFRNKLLIALGLPKSYLAQEDPALTRLNLSSQDIRFAKRIERHQMVLASAIRTLCKRHLELIGFPAKEFKDLKVKMTPSSDWREISRNEVIEARFNRAAAIKGAQLMSDYDILVDVLKLEPDKAKDFVSRLKMQKLDDMKIQAMAQNPRYLGLVEPNSAGNEIGTEAGGPTTELNPEEGAGEENQQPQEQQNIPNQNQNISLLPEPTEADIDKYNLQINNYAKDKDEEDLDLGELLEETSAKNRKEGVHEDN